MVGRIFLAGFAGAVAMFIWTAIAHMALPLGAAGFSQMPDEAAVTSGLASSMGSQQPGLYLFPWADQSTMTTAAGRAAYNAKLKTSPSGMLLYRPAGQDAGMTTGMLISEFIKQFVVCTIAAFLLAEAKLPKLWERAGFVAAIGAVAALETNVSYRIWYMFPSVFTAAAIATSFIGYVAAGFAVAALVKPDTPRPLA